MRDHAIPSGTPANLRPYVKAVGVKNTVQFLLAFGGTELNPSRRVTERSAVAKKFGLDFAQKIADLSGEYGWQPRVPLASEWVAQQLILSGHTVADVARRLRVADTTVRRWTVDERERRDIDQLKQLRLPL